MKRHIVSESPTETMRIAELIGSNLRGGETLELISDLGGGKTTFVRGLARGTGSKDVVRSPSFTLGNEYQSNRLTLYHFDFYRLEQAGIMRAELAEALADPKAAVVIEWGNIIEDVLPKTKFIVNIRATGADTRELTLTYPDKFEYLLKNT
jgi:tRNA threonylcarbamoyladenosine biosynthesis protein TsaE